MAWFSYFNNDIYLDIISVRTLSEKQTQTDLKNKGNLLISEVGQVSGLN